MTTKLSEPDFALALSAILDRVQRGERIVVERDGQPLAVLTPPGRAASAGTPGRKIFERLGALRMPGDGFADDIAAARANVLPVAGPAWPD